MRKIISIDKTMKVLFVTKKSILLNIFFRIAVHGSKL